MSEATVTSKGQITIPKAVREALRVGPGDRVAFYVRENGTVVVEAATVDVQQLRGLLKPAGRGVTIDAMNATIRRRGGGEE